MGRVEPAAEPHLDDREVHVLLREPAEEHRGQQLELRGRPVPPLHPVGGSKHLTNEARERRRIDRPPVDLQPLPVADEMWLRRRPDPDSGRAQCAPGDGEDAALAVRPADERAANCELRIADGMEEGACSTETEANAEPAPFGQGRDRRVIGGCVRFGRRWASRAQRPLSSSS